MEMSYPVEILDANSDNGTMVDSLADLSASVVGHRIVSAKREGSLVLTLDDGREVTLVGRSDCCAYTDIEAFLLNPELVDHIITGVGTTDEYTQWHIFADMGDVLKLTVNWTAGNPFYYAYGFDIRVVDKEENKLKRIQEVVHAYMGSDSTLSDRVDEIVEEEL